MAFSSISPLSFQVSIKASYFDLPSALTVVVCLCMCTVRTCRFPSVLFIDTFCLNLMLCPYPLPLLSVQPFLLWWGPALTGHSFSWDTRWTRTFLSVCLFPVSFKFRESVCKQESTDSDSSESIRFAKNKLWQNWSCLDLDPNWSYAIKIYIC